MGGVMNNVIMGMKRGIQPKKGGGVFNTEEGSLAGGRVVQSDLQEVIGTLAYYPAPHRCKGI